MNISVLRFSIERRPNRHVKDNDKAGGWKTFVKTSQPIESKSSGGTVCKIRRGIPVCDHEVAASEQIADQFLVLPSIQRVEHV